MLIRVIVFLLTVWKMSVPVLAQGDSAQVGNSTRESIIATVKEIQKAAYEGDRTALQRLHDQLTPLLTDKPLASRMLYWRGFALWRKGMNGLNENPVPKDLERDFNLAIADFNDSIVKDPGNIESRIGKISCLNYVLSLTRSDQIDLRVLMQQVLSTFLKQAQSQAPDNPRLLWVIGPMLWSSAPGRGGGQEKAFDAYNRGLAAIRGQKPPSDPLEPSWGEPELLASLAWSSLNRTTPELDAADQQVHAALQLVPKWHYARDVLLPQIEEAKAKANAKTQ